jgi:hypothetical protein
VYGLFTPTNAPAKDPVKINTPPPANTVTNRKASNKDNKDSTETHEKSNRNEDKLLNDNKTNDNVSKNLKLKANDPRYINISKPPTTMIPGARKNPASGVSPYGAFPNGVIHNVPANKINGNANSASSINATGSSSGKKSDANSPAGNSPHTGIPHNTMSPALSPLNIMPALKDLDPKTLADLADLKPEDNVNELLSQRSGSLLGLSQLPGRIGELNPWLETHIQMSKRIFRCYYKL